MVIRWCKRAHSRPGRNSSTRRSTLFDAVGYGRTGLNDIADRAGVVRGAFYYYFPTKESVAAANFQQADAKVNEAMTSERLRVTSAGALCQYRRRGHHGAVFVAPPCVLDPQARVRRHRHAPLPV